MDIIGLLLSVGEFLSGAIDKLKTGSREKTERLATFFDQISSNLESIAKTMREGGEPIRQCSELSCYLMDLPNMIGNRLDHQEVETLVEYLEFASATPAGYSPYEISLALTSESGSSRDIKNRADQVDKVAGYFRATANKLRAKE
jgi:hypothetical protein